MTDNEWDSIDTSMPKDIAVAWCDMWWEILNLLASA